MYMFSGFTESANRSINTAIQIASELGHTFVGSEHLLYGLLEEENSVAAAFLQKKGVEKEEILNKMVASDGRGERVALTPEHLTPRAKGVLERAIREARKLGHTYVGTEHILLAILTQQDGYAVLFLNELGVDSVNLYSELLAELSNVGNNGSYSGENPYTGAAGTGKKSAGDKGAAKPVKIREGFDSGRR